jgi:hypothetical protein
MPTAQSKEESTLDRLFTSFSDAFNTMSQSVSLVDKLIDILLDILEYFTSPITGQLARLKLIETFNNRPLSTTLPLIFVLNILTLTGIAFLEITSPELKLALTSPTSSAFIASFTLSLWSYYQTVTTDPGTVPTDYHPEQVYLNFTAEEKRVKRLSRFCKRQQVYKPDRTHFCTPLNRNVLKLDHYCAFTGNAVGWNNYRYFLQFLVFANVGNGVALCKGIQTVTTAAGSMSIGKIFLLSQSLVLGGVLSAVLVPFLGFHVYLTSVNATTIEFCEGNKTSNVYDVGFFGNWAQVLGANPIYWVLPIERRQHRALQFPRTDYVGNENDEQDEKLLPYMADVDGDVSWKDAVLSMTSDVNELASKLIHGFNRILFYR